MMLSQNGHSHMSYMLDVHMFKAMYGAESER